MPTPEEVYLLLKVTGGIDVTPLVAHTTQQGSAMEMVSYPAEEQRNMWVAPVRLVDDGDN
jgi:hypothetical protein